MNKILILVLMMGSQVFAQGFEYKNTDFKSLYNNYQAGQPEVVPWAGDFFPYAYNGTAVGIDVHGNKCTGESCGRSAMEALGELAGHQKAYEWEKKHHSCSELSEDQKESCRGWWGHCNGWAAAAIKDPEPKTSMQIRGVTLSVGEQKGILSELWLTCNSLFTGNTNKSLKTDKWVADTESADGKSFWDVTPRTFFMLMTNYVGVLKTGVVIDRFTGDEVWNQPVVGYKHLPIDKEDIWSKSGRHFVRLTTELYWANDLGTSPGHISSRFDIHSSDILNNLSRDYEERSLTYTLEFDKPVTLTSDGSVESAGRIIGDGSWQHYVDFEKSGDHSRLNQTHPDFIWLPTNPILDQNGYGNPHIDMKVIAEISKKLHASAPAPAPRPAPTPNPVEPTPAPAPTPAPVVEASDFYVLKFKVSNEKLKIPQGLSEADRRKYISKKVQEYLAAGNYSDQVLVTIDQSDASFTVITTKTKFPRTQKEIKRIASKLSAVILLEQAPTN